MFIDEEEGVKGQITDETAGRVCNLALNPRHRVDKQYLTTLLTVLNKYTTFSEFALTATVFFRLNAPLIQHFHEIVHDYDWIRYKNLHSSPPGPRIEPADP